MIGVALLAVVFYLIGLVIYKALESWAVDKQEEMGDHRTYDLLE